MEQHQKYIKWKRQYTEVFSLTLIADNDNKGGVRAAPLEAVAINRRLEWQKEPATETTEKRSQCKDQNVGMSLSKPRNLEKAR